MRIRSLALRVAAVGLAAASMSAFSSTTHADDGGSAQHTVTVTDGTISISRAYLVGMRADIWKSVIRQTYREKGMYYANGRRYTMTGTSDLTTRGRAASRALIRNRARVWVNDGVGTCTLPTLDAATKCAQTSAKANALAKAQAQFPAYYAASVATDRAEATKTANTNATRRALAAARKAPITAAMKRNATAAAKADGVRRAKAYAAQSTTSVAASVPQALSLANAERAKKRLPALSASSCAQKFANKQAVAQARADRMHHTPDLYTVLSGCGSSTVGENVAAGYPTAAAVMNGWMNSPGHRANILSRKYTAVAVAVAYSSDGIPYYAQVFLG